MHKQNQLTETQYSSPRKGKLLFRQICTDRELIRRANRDGGREARGNEEREKRAIEKGSREGIEKREREFERRRTSPSKKSCKISQ